MNNRTTLAFLLVLAWSGLALAEPPPVEAFGQKPAMIDVDMNPAGTRLAWIEDNGKVTRLVIHDLLAKKPLRALNVAAGQRLVRLYWANDETVLLDQRITRSVDNGRNTYEWQRWTALDARGGADRILLMQEGNREWVTGATLVRHNTTRPGKVYMTTLDFSSARYREEIGTRLSGGRKDSGWIHNLYEVDVGTGDGKVLASGSAFTDDWLVDAAGTRILRSDWNPKYNQSEILVKGDHGWRALYKASDCGHLTLRALNADSSAAIVSGKPCGEDREKLFTLALDGSAPQALFEDAQLEVDHVYLDPLDRGLLGVVLGGPKQPTRWLDAQADRRSAGLHRTFKNSSVALISRSADYKRVVVLVESATQAPVYYLVDYGAKTADIINERYPQLNGVTLGAVREFNYLARDQYALLAYLTLPPGAQEKNLPVVVLPHGGPEARDEPGFDWMTQFLASRGYAVFQPQFRGSSGFGKAHADAGRHQWGLLMQDDVTDGVKALIAQGIADPGRICIAGISYGGYAALAGAVYTPELYACAASIGGVSDLPNMLGWVQKGMGKESNSLAYWRDHIGGATDAHVVAKSPARNATAARAPILLIHGTDDTTVPIDQSRAMARALAAAGKKHDFIELEGDDHYLSMSTTRVRTLRELEKFLASSLPPAQGAAPAPAAQ
jgi:dipeptidyl aminopeptidase/acylaminoacyl peptidase